MRVYITTKDLLKENRMIKLSHPLFEDGSAEVTLERLCVPLAHTGSFGRLPLGALARRPPQIRDVTNSVTYISFQEVNTWH